VKKIIKLIYYFIYDLLKILKNFGKTNNFIILIPRCFGVFFKTIPIYDKFSRKFFFQSVRNNYDILTVFEIFSEETYCLTRLKKWKNINKIYNDIIKDNLKPLVIDCGSNIGCSTEYFYRIFTKAKFLSIEPNHESLTFSKKNISSSEVTLINKAINSDEKKLLIDMENEDNRASKISIHYGKEIDSISIDSLINNRNGSIPFIIKIDIEGFEDNLFLKNYDWIDKFNIIIIEIHDWMLPGKSNSYNFFKALVENMNKGSKRDIIISGENLISIKNDQ
jgi:FkbM family methyltransferase